MKRKLIALDLDGTLLRPDHTVSEKTRQLLIRLNEQGHHILIATGRILTSAQAVQKSIGFAMSLIGCNGAVIYDQLNNRYISDSLNHQTVRQVIEIFQKHHIYHHLYNEDTIFANRMDYTAKRYHEDRLNTPQSPHVKQVVIKEDLRELLNDQLNVYKLGFYDKDCMDLAAVQRDLSQVAGIFAVYSNFNLIDIMKEGITKWSGIEHLLKSYHLRAVDVIAIGDSPNDYQMIKQAGVGVAMANADPMIRQVSDAVTGSNQEDGVYHYLKGYFETYE